MMVKKDKVSSKVDLQSLKEKYPEILTKELKDYPDTLIKKLSSFYLGYLESSDPIEKLDIFMSDVKVQLEAPKISEEEREKSRAVAVAKMAVDRLIGSAPALKACSESGTVPCTISSTHPDHTPRKGNGIDPKIAAHWARYRLLENKIAPLEKKERDGKLREITIKYKNKMKEEKYAISDYLDGKRNHPTTWDKDILRDYPSAYLQDNEVVGENDVLVPEKKRESNESVAEQEKRDLRNPEGSRFLEGQKEISTYFGKSWQTVKKYAKKGDWLQYTDAGKPITTTFEIDQFRIKTAA